MSTDRQASLPVHETDCDLDLDCSCGAPTPWMNDGDVQLYEGNAADVLRTLPEGSVQTCVTSPPYWGNQRDYGHELQLGNEETPDEFAAALCEVFNGVWRVLREDGTLWLNLGDTYAASGQGGGGSAMAKRGGQWGHRETRTGWRKEPEGYRRGDIIGIPWLVAGALRRAGWVVRRDVIWDKMVPTEPTRSNRPNVQHEVVLLLAKSHKYAFHLPAEQIGTVWRMRPENATPGHPATFPKALAARCIQLGSAPGDLVLDPFMGSGTTAIAARDMGRRAVGIDLSTDYLKLATDRLAQQSLLAPEIA